MKYAVAYDRVYTPAHWPAQVKADLYQPRTALPVPAVLLLHGGGWSGPDGRWQMRRTARLLASHGYFVMNASYRTAPEWKYPAATDDLREALNWIDRNAAVHRIDRRRIATYGYSAGGHLAALVGYTDPRVKAVIAGGAPSDMSLYPDGKLVRRFLGGTYREIPRTYREASPVSHVNASSPATFIFHGTADTTVPPEHARRLEAALRRSGVKHETLWLEGKSHALTLLSPGDSENRAIRFLDANLRAR